MTPAHEASTADLLRACDDLGATLLPDAGRLRIRAREPLPARLLEEITAHKAEILAALIRDRVEAAWNPGDRIAYREGGELVTAKYAGTGSGTAVNVWLADGALRAIPAEAVALDWDPEAAEILEERLCVMLDAGIAEDEARARAEVCTREYLERVRHNGGSASVTAGS